MREFLLFCWFLAGTNQASSFYGGQHHGGQQGTPQQHSQQPQSQQQQQQQHGYFTYPSYRPSSGYQSYYQQQQHHQPQSTPTSTTQTAGVGYQPPTLQASKASSPAASVSYPTYANSGYASSANAYFSQKQQQQSQQQSQQHLPSSSYTPQQEQVISQYIQQKHQSPSGTTNFPGRKPQRPYPSPQQQPIYYCEVCRISCASAAVRDVLEHGHV